MTTPAWQISVGGGSVTGDLNDRLLELVLTLHDGHENDELTIQVDDRDFAVADPGTGTEVSVSIGYKETGLVYQGKFKVDSVSVHGFPMRMQITATGADQKEAQKQQRSLKYEKKTLGDIINECAARYGLQAYVSGELASIQYPYLNQTEESDWHLNTRLSHDHDALFSVKNGIWMFVKRGDSVSMGGLSMPRVIISAWDLIEYEASHQDRAKHGKSRAWWHNRKKGVVESVDSSSSGSGSARGTVRHSRHSKRLAQSAADAKQGKLKRAEGECTVVVIGDPTLQPEGTMLVQTGRSILDGEWLIKTVTHTISSNGFRTKVHGETPHGAGSSGGG
jgi:phage protein D